MLQFALPHGYPCMTNQEQFDKMYVTSSEICRRVGVTRAAVIQARAKNFLPEPIILEGTLSLWKREDVEGQIVLWIQKRMARIGVA